MQICPRSSESWRGDRDDEQSLHDPQRAILTRERPAVTEVVTWAAGNGDRSENADYQYRYRKKRLREIDLDGSDVRSGPGRCWEMWHRRTGQ